MRRDDWGPSCGLTWGPGQGIFLIQGRTSQTQLSSNYGNGTKLWEKIHLKATNRVREPQTEQEEQSPPFLAVKDVFILLSRTYEYVTLHGKIDFTDRIKFKASEMGRLSWLCLDGPQQSVWIPKGGELLKAVDRDLDKWYYLLWIWRNRVMRQELWATWNGKETNSLLGPPAGRTTLMLAPWDSCQPSDLHGIKTSDPIDNFHKCSLEPHRWHVRGRKISDAPRD